MKTLASVLLVLAAFVAGTGCTDGASPDDGATGGSDSLATVIGDAKPATGSFEGLTEINLSVDGTCVRVVVVDTEPERIEGLRGVDDLGVYAGMLFVFDGNSTARFTMADTLVPLTIGFYDESGDQVSQTEMVPCPATETQCPLYAADTPYRYALEIPAGPLGSGPITPC